jgi:hypothetical protein
MAVAQAAAADLKARLTVRGGGPRLRKGVI